MRNKLKKYLSFYEIDLFYVGFFVTLVSLVVGGNYLVIKLGMGL